MFEKANAKVILVMGLLLVLVPISASFAGTEDLVDGTLHIRNGSEPDQGIETRQLEEIWRVGGDEEDDLLLGIINRVRADEQGNVFILDTRLSQVMVISPEGELSRTLGREGTGPGEITGPQDFAFLPDGTLGMVQTFPGKLVKLNLDGTPAGEVIPTSGDPEEGGFLVLVTCRSGGGQIVLGGFEDSITGETGAQRSRTFFVRGFDAAGTQLASFIEKEIDWDFSQPGFKHREIENDFIWWRLDVGSDGKVVACEPRDDYALSVYNPDGTLDRIIEREYETWPRTDKIRSRYQGIFDSQLRAYPPGTVAEVEDTEQDVADLQVDDEGNIWVLTSRAMFEPDPDCFATYDVFSPEGHFQKQVRLVCAGDVGTDRMYFPSPGLAIQVTGFWDAFLNRGGSEEDGKEPQPMQVVCYRIK